MHISFDISPIIFILIGISACFCLLYFLWEFYNYRSLKKSLKISSEKRLLSATDTCDETQGVTVIVYCDNEEYQLKQNLPQLLSQDYPLYEVIVVNNCKNEEIQDYVERLSIRHDNLHYSFTPDNASNLSRKKLAIMIGIKAAKYDIILNTNAHCAPQSNKWVSSMARHFADGADVVIGHATIADGSDTSFGCRLRAFISLRNAVKYLVQAINYKAYRGTSDNIAYRKTTFFKNKGFHRSLHLHYGDDDLFINEIATKHNTCVEISPESVVTIFFNNPARVFSTLKSRHAFTERKIRSGAFFRASLSTMRFYCCIITALTIMVLGYNNVITLSGGILLLLLLIIPQILLYRKMAKLLQSRELMLTVPLLTLLQPWINLHYNIDSRLHTDYNYTWQRLKN